MKGKFSVKYFNVISDESVQEFKRYGVDGEGYDVVICRSHKLHDNKDINKGGNADSVVETTICKLLMGGKNMCEAINFVKRSDMEPKGFERVKKNFKGHELKGKTIVIIGMGMIGARLAAKCTNLGMKVIGKDMKIDLDFLNGALNRHPDGAALWKSIEAGDGYCSVRHDIGEIQEGHVVISDDWWGMVGRADYITIHCGFWGKPVFDREFFRKSKKGLVLVNCDRGELVVEEEVLFALERNHLRNYHTDFPPADLKLRKHPRCFPTPHMAATTQSSQDNCGRMVVDQVLAYLYEGQTINSKNFWHMNLPRQGNTRVCIASRVAIPMKKVTNALGKYNVLQSRDVSCRGKAPFYALIDLGEDFENAKKDLVAQLKKLKFKGKVRVIGRNKAYEERLAAKYGKKKEVKKVVKGSIVKPALSFGFGAGLGVGLTFLLLQAKSKMK